MNNAQFQHTSPSVDQQWVPQQMYQHQQQNPCEYHPQQQFNNWHHEKAALIALFADTVNKATELSKQLQHYQDVCTNQQETANAMCSQMQRLEQDKVQQQEKIQQLEQNKVVQQLEQNKTQQLEQDKIQQLEQDKVQQQAAIAALRCQVEGLEQDKCVLQRINNILLERQHQAELQVAATAASSAAATIDPPQDGIKSEEKDDDIKTASVKELHRDNNSTTVSPVSSAEKKKNVRWGDNVRVLFSEATPASKDVPIGVNDKTSSTSSGIDSRFRVRSAFMEVRDAVAYAERMMAYGNGHVPPMSRATEPLGDYVHTKITDTDNVQRGNYEYSRKTVCLMCSDRSHTTQQHADAQFAVKHNPKLGILCAFSAAPGGCRDAHNGKCAKPHSVHEREAAKKLLKTSKWLMCTDNDLCIIFTPSTKYDDGDMVYAQGCGAEGHQYKNCPNNPKNYRH